MGARGAWGAGLCWLLLLLLLLGAAASPGPGSAHSLRYFYTAISDPEPGLPAYVSVGYLDDLLFVECDSHSGLYKPRAQWIKDNVGADYWESGTKRGVAKQQWFEVVTRIVMERYNQSGGTHAFQYKSGCEIRQDGSTAGFRQFAYDGKDFLSFDLNTTTWIAAAKEAEITQRRWNADPADLQYRKHYTEKECVEWLTKYQQYGKEALQRREPTAVEVSDQATPDGLTHLSCRVYGFYPRDIAVSWMKNGAMGEHKTWREDILPSGDGTYQVRAVTKIDLKEGGRYSCHVIHSSLPEPLNILWELKAGWVPVAAGAAAVVLAAALAAIGVVIWRQTRSGRGPAEVTRDPVLPVSSALLGNQAAELRLSVSSETSPPQPQLDLGPIRDGLTESSEKAEGDPATPL